MRTSAAGPALPLEKQDSLSRGQRVHVSGQAASRVAITLEDVRSALQLPGFDSRGAQRLMAPRPRTLFRPPDRPGRPRSGAVLLLLFPLQGRLDLVLTRRTEELSNHRGQISLPGGGQEAGEALEATAIREACEELGVGLDGIRVLGSLAPLYIPPSDFEIHPFVAYCASRPEFAPAPAEVAELLEVPLERILEPWVHLEEERSIRGHWVQVPFYNLGKHKAWGATAMVLSELEQRLWVTVASPPAVGVQA